MVVGPSETDDKCFGFEEDVECRVHDEAGPSMHLALGAFKLLEGLDDVFAKGPDFRKVQPWGN